MWYLYKSDRLSHKRRHDFCVSMCSLCVIFRQNKITHDKLNANDEKRRKNFPINSIVKFGRKTCKYMNKMLLKHATTIKAKAKENQIQFICGIWNRPIEKW